MYLNLSIVTVFAIMVWSVIDINEPPKTSLQKPVENITYFKDKVGICYASLASDNSGGHKVISITAVPCEKVGL